MKKGMQYLDMTYLVKDLSNEVSSKVILDFYKNKELDKAFVENLKSYAYQVAENDLEELNKLVFDYEPYGDGIQKTFVVCLRNWSHFDCFEAIGYLDPLLAYNLYEEIFNEGAPPEDYHTVNQKEDYKELSDLLLSMLSTFYRERVEQVLRDIGLNIIGTSDAVILDDLDLSYASMTEKTYIVCSLPS